MTNNMWQLIRYSLKHTQNLLIISLCWWDEKDGEISQVQEDCCYNEIYLPPEQHVSHRSLVNVTLNNTNVKLWISPYAETAVLSIYCITFKLSPILGLDPYPRVLIPPT